MNKLLLIIYILIGFAFVFWLLSLAICELSTSKHSAEFQLPDEVIMWVQEGGEIKIIDYSEQSAIVYYTQKNAGFRIDFSKFGDKWVVDTWRTVWSTSGSSDDFIWPYFYHSTGGLSLLLVVVLPVFGVSILTLFFGSGRKKARGL